MRIHGLTTLVIMGACMQGCHSGSVSRIVFEDTGRTYSIYQLEVQEASKDAFSYYGAGDNRDRFRPAIYSPYYLPQTWFVAFIKDSGSVRFSFVSQTGVSEDESPVYTEYVVSQPKWEFAENGSQIRGAGLAEGKQYVWQAKENVLQPYGEPLKPSSIRFVLGPVSGFLPLAPPPGVRRLLQYESSAPSTKPSGS